MKKTIGACLEDVYEQLRSERKVKSKEDFAAKVGSHSNSIREMVTGKRPPTLGIIINLYYEFGINANYLVSAGEGPMYAKREGKLILQDIETIDQHVKYLREIRRELEFLKKEIESKDKIIALLEAQSKGRMNTK